jgi:hypothetical protein
MESRVLVAEALGDVVRMEVAVSIVHAGDSEVVVASPR